VSTNVYVLLLNPAIACILASAMLIIWYHRPSADAMRTAAIGLFAFAVAFVVQDIVPALPYRLSNLFTNMAFLAAVTLICVAVIETAGGKVPLLALGLTALATVGAILWWLYVDDDLTARIHVMNVSHSVMSLVTLIATVRSRWRGWGRSLAIAVSTLALLNFSWRPLQVMWEGNFYADQNALHDSIYWNTTRLGSPILAVFAALSLLVGLAVVLMKELKLEARLDKLSGCLNRRGFEEQSLHLLQAPDRSTLRLTMIVADIDRFKQINDTLGHATGDAVIRAFGRTLMETMPPDAVVGRIGGEEFAILLAGEEADRAYEITTSFQKDLSTTLQSQDLPLATASFGIYNCGYQDDLSTILSRADMALYEAKNDGRDAIRMHHPRLRTVQTRAKKATGS